MAKKLKRLLLLAGRYLPENPYRELVIKHLLEAQGVEVLFALPGRSLNKAANLDLFAANPVFAQEKVIRLEGVYDFQVAMRRCDMVLFSTWRSYLPLTLMAQAEGRATLNFCATSGLDHWAHGVAQCLVRSEYTKRMLKYDHESLGLPLPEMDQIRVVGSIQCEYLQGENTTPLWDRETFCHHYGLKADRPIAVLFPKGIGSFREKIPGWFPQWNDAQVSSYHAWFLRKYAEICTKVREADLNLIIKLHPSSYASYRCQREDEYLFWKQFEWGKILQPEHSRSMYTHADVGLGINTHAAMDMGYYGKPFIYVDPDLIEPPKSHAFASAMLAEIPAGPSSHWHNPSATNPWFHSWLGRQARIQDLATLLNDPAALALQPQDIETFIGEYWYKNDGQSAHRIVNAVLNFDQVMDHKKSMPLATKWRRTWADAKQFL